MSPLEGDDRTVPGEEPPTARGADDELLRYERATRDQYGKQVTLKIDGLWVRLPVAVPSLDSQGNIRRAPDGTSIPRFTTLHDAAIIRFQNEPGELARRIPILCHQEHMDPVAVCRICSVQVNQLQQGGKTRRGRKLMPACKHRAFLDDRTSLEVFTRGWQGREGEVVRTAVNVLTECLLADHLHPGQAQEGRYRNELQVLSDAFGVSAHRFLASEPASRNRPLPGARPLPDSVAGSIHPYSSSTIRVDHDNCILCDRCVRACTDVKPFKIIGHTGKGYRTRISFDLDQIMAKSGCVQCGECMVSCPTGALSFSQGVYEKTLEQERQKAESRRVAGPAVIDAEELEQLTFPVNREEARLFQNIPLNFLKWNEGAVIRRECRAGQVLCQQGDYGSTAFVIQDGTFEVRQKQGEQAIGPPRKASRSWARVFGHPQGDDPSPEKVPFNCTDEQADQWFGPVIPGGTRTRADLIVGEFASAKSLKRKATVRARSKGNVLVIRRNLLHMLQRRREFRDLLDGIYCRRAIETCIRDSALFADLSADDRERILGKLLALVPTPAARSERRANDLSAGADQDQPIQSHEAAWQDPGVSLWRAEPGQRIVTQGDRPDGFYIIWLGFVEISRHQGGREVVIDHMHAGQHFGEIALFAENTAALSRRTSSCTALDHVELVRIRGQEFKEICLGVGAKREYRDLQDIQQKIRRQIENASARLLERNRLEMQLIATPREDFVKQKLFQGQKLLVLDLERCTRCDECTRACEQSHHHVSRLVREGLRIENYLVATSCRSCHQPYCLDGCPVDAIHRGARSLEIRIEPWCIGCGLCANNCPFGSIRMVDASYQRNPAAQEISNVERHAQPDIARKATTCDLCNDLVGPDKAPNCVASCPHDAAFRWNAEELWERIRNDGSV